MTSGFAFKVECPNGELRRFRSEYDACEGRLRLGHSELRTQVARLSGVKETHLLLTWEDNDGDLITFDTEEELLDAVRCAAAGGRKVLRIAAKEQVPSNKDDDQPPAVTAEDETGWCMVEPAGAV